MMIMKNKKYKMVYQKLNKIKIKMKTKLKTKNKLKIRYHLIKIYYQM